MQTFKLGEIAKIDISNVDKKSKNDETPVILCNFVDVYYNWAITSSMIPNLMTATANANQLERFSIHKGQVAITKDSETRDDIGVAAYIADDIPNGVLGYHCALITPDKSKLNGKYLNVLLHSPYAQKYFEANASGSGQRYTLTNEIISGLPIPLPDMETQHKIGKFFSNIDRKISNNNAINAELEAMAKTIYDYWFLQFEFPDENGKPYKSSGGKMVWNNELKREIPYGWTVGNLVENDISTVIKPGVQYFTKKNYLATANVVNDVIFEGDWISFENRESRANMEPKLLSVWFAKMKNSIKHISIPSTGTWFLEKYILSTGFVGIACTETSFPYIHSIINSKSFEIIKDKLSHGATQEAVNNDDLKFVRFVVPTEKILQDYSYKTTPLLEKKFDIIRENQELASLRDFLLPLLMNGQVAFKAEG